MAVLGEVYKCGLCGNIVCVVNGGDGDLVCCGEDMELQKENTVDAAKEKHVPVLEKSGTGCKVKVGAVAHPMTEEHYIQWIRVVNGDYVNVKMLHPGDAPEAEFYVPVQGGLVVQAYCNKHGLWRN